MWRQVWLPGDDPTGHFNYLCLAHPRSVLSISWGGSNAVPGNGHKRLSQPILTVCRDGCLRVWLQGRGDDVASFFAAVVLAAPGPNPCRIVCAQWLSVLIAPQVCGSAALRPPALSSPALFWPVLFCSALLCV